MAGAIVSEHQSTSMTQPLSTLARINTRGYHLPGKQRLQYLQPNNLTSISGKTRACSHLSWLMVSSINLSILPFLFWINAPLSTSLTCSSSVAPASNLHSLHPVSSHFLPGLALSITVSTLPFLQFSVTILFTATKYLQLPPIACEGSPSPCRDTPQSLSCSAPAPSDRPGG